MDWAQLANTYTSALVALCCIVFAIVYHLHAPWRSTAVGRHLMVFTLAIGYLYAYTVLITIWPEGPTATVLRSLRITMSLLTGGLVIQRIHMVLRAQHRGSLVDSTPDRRDRSE
jgi:hypothetical protein